MRQSLRSPLSPALPLFHPHWFLPVSLKLHLLLSLAPTLAPQRAPKLCYRDTALAAKDKEFSASGSSIRALTIKTLWTATTLWKSRKADPSEPSHGRNCAQTDNGFLQVEFALGCSASCTHAQEITLRDLFQGFSESCGECVKKREKRSLVEARARSAARTKRCVHNSTNEPTQQMAGDYSPTFSTSSFDIWYWPWALSKQLCLDYYWRLTWNNWLFSDFINY